MLVWMAMIEKKHIKDLKSTEKIDGAVAMIMALDRAIRCGCVSDESVYDTRDMLVL